MQKQFSEFAVTSTLCSLFIEFFVFLLGMQESQYCGGVFCSQVAPYFLLRCEELKHI